MIFQTERMILRPWEEGDAEQVYELAKDPLVGPPTGWSPHKDMEESTQILKNVLMVENTWAMCLKDGTVIGNISMFKSEASAEEDRHQEAELGFWLGSAYWGKGYMPEAIFTLQKHAFEVLGMKRLWCMHWTLNEKSARTQEKTGFRYHHYEAEKTVGPLGITRPTIVNALTREEWECGFIVMRMTEKQKAVSSFDLNSDSICYGAYKNRELLGVLVLNEDQNEYAVLPENVSEEVCSELMKKRDREQKRITDMKK